MTILFNRVLDVAVAVVFVSLALTTAGATAALGA